MMVMMETARETYIWRFVLLYFARVELAARDVAVHDVVIMSYLSQTDHHDHY